MFNMAITSLPKFNPPQAEAIANTEGPLVVYAGAGSGKTMVISYRIAKLIDNGVAPSAIFAVTFTNKAAKEMRDRVERIVGYRARSMVVSTFHSACVRMLRMYAPEIGYTENFSIYDDDDKGSILKNVLQELNINSKHLTAAILKHRIDTLKNRGETPELFAERIKENSQAGFTARILRSFGEAEDDGLILKCYQLYQKKLKELNAMDFNDLLLETVLMFESKPHVLQQLQSKYKYFLVDEFQDTNPIQFRLISLLSAQTQNLCIVGDDDQSIYSWRGAEPSFIMNFNQYFPKAQTIKLEQNYRSTEAIIKAASELIACNQKRAPKVLWTENPKGSPIQVRRQMDGHSEAKFIADRILEGIEKGNRLSDYGILYRTNAQSRLLEDELRRRMIPYVIYGALRFYDRAEIKLLLSYLKLIINPDDNLAFTKIINTPRRGLGEKGLSAIYSTAAEHDISYIRAAAKIARGEVQVDVGRGQNKLRELIDMYSSWYTDLSLDISPADVFSNMLSQLNLREFLANTYPEELEERWANILELKNALYDFNMKPEETSSTGEIILENSPKSNQSVSLQILSEFLQQAQLVSETKAKDVESGNTDAISMLTIHAAKGLEFERVFITGADEGVLPHFRSLEDEQAIEEERRLMYVAITRAKSELTITWTQLDNYEGRRKEKSRFLLEIPKACIDEGPKAKTRIFTEDFSSNERVIQTDFSNNMSSFNALKARQLNNFDNSSENTAANWETGKKVNHKLFGDGVIQEVEKSGENLRITVNFRAVGVKKLIHTYLTLRD